MRDGRLIRLRHPSQKRARGILLVALGSRTRFKDFGDESVEERNNDKTRMYLR